MKTLSIMTALILSMLHNSRAETSIAVNPVNYLKMQLEIRWIAQEVLVSAQRIQHSPKASREEVWKMQGALSEALDAATSLSIQLPYEQFNLAVGNQLMQNVVRLTAIRDAAYQVEITRDDIDLLKKIESLCKELAE